MKAMENTNRKEMRKLLNKCCALMKAAFDNGVNMEITLRDADKDNPWFVGYIYEEGCDFTVKDGRSRSFSVYNFRSVEENEAELSAIEKFIENHKK